MTSTSFCETRRVFTRTDFYGIRLIGRPRSGRFFAKKSSTETAARDVFDRETSRWTFASDDVRDDGTPKKTLCPMFGDETDIT